MFILHASPPPAVSRDGINIMSTLNTPAPNTNLEALLPSGVRSRLIPDVNGLTMHVLEAGFESEGRPVIVLLHGFPELAFSWRRVMPVLAAAGFHVIAPDQ